MSLDDAFRAAVRDEVRAVVREEIRAALAETRSSTAVGEAYLSIKQAAELAGVHVDTIRDWVKTGGLRPTGSGRRIRIRRDVLCRYLENAAENTHRPTAEEDAVAILASARSR